ncbi:hypothetical protein FSP39_012674 [Pinctada imbricata]|uniref:Phosphatidylinositol 3-kinase catalytic subunit type 3 n=1 Tax=Pinctada imbricata TaxID=66713 RepID=A0AA89C5C2_PINIB|nr:hypothetical protein FSP39_012674 [Pinctada imbricata]
MDYEKKYRFEGLKKLSYRHPPRLQIQSQSDLRNVRDRIGNGIQLSVTIQEANVEYTMRQSQDSLPRRLIEEALKKWSNKTGKYQQSPEEFTLKVVGLEDYIYGDHPLIHFKYIYGCLLTGHKPQLWLIRLKDILEKHSSILPFTRKQSAPNIAPRPSVKRGGGPYCWDIPVSVQNYYLYDIQDYSVRVYAGLFHGPQTLCVIHTNDVIVYNGSCHWRKELEFSLNVQDLPQSCRLCLSLHLKKGKELTMLTWVNIPVFNYKNRLIQGTYKLPMWPRQEHIELIENCNPIGTVSSNPQGDHATSVEFKVPDYGPDKILYPPDEKVLQCASNNMEEPGKPGSPNWHPSKSHIAQFEEKLDEYRNGSLQMTEQDKELIWMMRYESRDRYPEALPLLLDSVSWELHINVAKMQALLQTWKTLDIEQALCLLDFHYPDTNVRRFACICLRDLSDDELSQYMLQMVQALKYESHLLCPLTEFLLERALVNQHLGHQLYWLLKTKKCKVMDSKKKPLWLEWTNADPKGSNIHIMYKNGDDLRQDMLTLQIFSIMDNFWKNEGLDLRLHPYGCIATGWEEGMIELVTPSNTIANIQKRKGAFAQEALYEWLKQKNSKEGELKAAVEEFTYSCAGYAVATYILGIGDRHNGNIMLKENGQLFHIDFGHFLGNFKSKFYIKRERVPFILTSHFEYVIKKGEDKDLSKFYDICERAYLIIRQRGQLLMRLFLMMLSAGIPQLMTTSDVDYLKETLALALSDDEAKRKFKAKFKEAQEKSWSTSLNWWFHIKAH